MPTFVKAQKSTRKLRMALEGPSGSGKTWTALALAQALGQRIALIDTEHGGASHYADHFDFDTLELTSFHPERYIEALQAAANEHYEVVIIDSLSHAWMGKDGALELVDRAAKRSQSGNSYTAWREVTPLQTRLIDAMLGVPFHLLVTMRSKMEYVIEEDRHGKKVPKKVGMAPVQRDGVEYEFDVIGELDQAHTLVVTKSRLHRVADLVIEKPGADFGHRLLDAITGSIPLPVSPATGELFDDDHPLVRRVNTLLEEQGVDAEARTRYWASRDRKYAGRSEVTLGLMYDELQQAATRKLAEARERERLEEEATRKAVEERLAEDKRLALEASLLAEESDDLPPETLVGSGHPGTTGPSWGPGSPDLFADEDDTHGGER